MQLVVEELKRVVVGMDCLIIILGIVFVYEYWAFGQVVANCYKVFVNDFWKYWFLLKVIVDVL